MRAGSAPRRLLWLAVGFGIWSSALVCLYAAHAIGCEFGWPGLRVSLFAILGLHLVLLAAVIRKIPAGRDFLSAVTAVTLWSALAATLLALAPPLFLTACL